MLIKINAIGNGTIFETIGKNSDSAIASAERFCSENNYKPLVINVEYNWYGEEFLVCLAAKF